MLEVEHHAELAAIVVRIVLHMGEIGPPGFPHSYYPLTAEARGIELADIVVQVRAVAHGQPVPLLAHHVDHIEAKSLDPFAQPEVDHRRHFGPHRRVVPVQIGLTGIEVVQVVAIKRWHVLPAAAAKNRGNGVSIDKGLIPEYVITLIAGIAGQCLHKPFVLGGGVVGDDIHHYADAVSGRFGDQLLHLGQGAEGGVDGAVVRHVVAVVPLGGAIDGGEPEHIDPEGGQIVEALADAVDVAHAVAIAVLKTHGVDLVDDAAIEVYIGRVERYRVHQRGRLGEARLYLTQMSGHSTGQGKP